MKRNTVVGPGIKSFDMSINKNFQIGDDHLEFRIEIFNLPNAADLGSARIAARHAELRRHHEHAHGLAAGSARVEVRVLEALIGARGKGRGAIPLTPHPLPLRNASPFR